MISIILLLECIFLVTSLARPVRNLPHCAKPFCAIGKDSNRILNPIHEPIIINISPNGRPVKIRSSLGECGAKLVDVTPPPVEYAQMDSDGNYGNIVNDVYNYQYARDQSAPDSTGQAVVPLADIKNDNYNAGQIQEGASGNTEQIQYGADSNTEQVQYVVDNNAEQIQYGADSNAEQVQYVVDNNGAGQIRPGEVASDANVYPAPNQVQPGAGQILVPTPHGYASEGTAQSVGIDGATTSYASVTSSKSSSESSDSTADSDDPDDADSGIQDSKNLACLFSMLGLSVFAVLIV